MGWLKGHFKQLRALFRRSAVERELDEELRFHARMEAEELMRRGVEPGEAWRQALVAFGGVERTKEQVREARWTSWIEDLARDARLEARSLARRPGFTVAAVATLALGIGATTLMFGVVDALFLSPPPGVRGADELVRIYIARDEGRIQNGPGGGNGSYPDYLGLREGAEGFEDIAAVASPEAVDLDRGPGARRITGQVVSANFFELLGAPAARGRAFVGAAAAAGGGPVVVISDRFWTRGLGGAPDVVGSTLLLNGARASVVGVASEGFTGITPEPVDVWVPAAHAAALGLMFEGWRTNALSIAIGYIGRLASGADVEAAGMSARAVLRHAAEQVAGLDPDPGVIVGPFITARGPKRSSPASVALWLALATGLLLLIACANVANLLLARTAARRHEIAVRLALGLGRGRLVRHLLTESLVLAALGCAAGVALALVGGAALLRFPLLPAAAGLNVRLLLFACGAAVLTGLLFGLAPALQALRVDPAGGLKESARRTPRGLGRLKSVLVAGQAAFAVIALLGAGLFVRSLTRALAVDSGLEIERVAVVSVDLESAGYDGSARRAFLDRARARLLALPGVEGVARARIPPLGGASYSTQIDPPGPDSAVAEDVYVNWVTPGFTRTMGIRLLAGRGFVGGDDEAAPPVALVTADAARLLAPGGDAVGLCVVTGEEAREGDCTRIAGVVESVRHMVLGETAPYLYLPWPQYPDAGDWGPPRMYVRTAGDPSARTRAIAAAVRGLAPDLPFVSVEPFARGAREDLLPLRIGAVLSGLFAGLALALTAVGMYGVLGHFVTERTCEIAVRRSLGARDGDVTRLVLTQGLIPVALGAGAGTLVALAGAGLLEALLFGVSARDPLTVALVLAFLGAVALLSSYVPAHRAARVDLRAALAEE